MANNQSVLIISPSLRIGGIARVLSELANYFYSQGITVYFISCLSGNDLYKLNDGIMLYEPTFGRKGGMLNKLSYYPKLVFYLRRIAKNLKPDFVLSFGDAFNPIALLALLNSGQKVFISDRTSADYKFKFPIPLLKRLLYPTSAGMIVQTVAAEKYKLKQFKGKIRTTVISNPVKFLELNNFSRENIILYVGRFAWEKAPDRLIRAFCSIANKNGWKLHMAGTGPLLEPMKDLVKQLGCHNEVVFYGQISHVEQLYVKASIYVLPSVLEGFPNALCEAMAAGLPCICFDGFPAHEIITNGFDGIILDNGNDSLLGASLVQLMDNSIERDRLGTNALAIKERLSIQAIGNHFLDFMTQ